MEHVSIPNRVRFRVWALVAFVVGLFGLWPAVATAAYTPPPMRDAVTDTAGKLSEGDDRALEEKITLYRNRTGNEIAVLVVRSLEGESIEDVAYTTFNRWGIGKKGLDNGVLLVIAPAERRTRIETGKGVGDRLTDIDCAIILRERVGPLLKEDRLHEAIDAAVDAIAALLDGGPAPPMPSSLTATPVVRGAFVVDQAGALDEPVLASLEADAAREGRYWAKFGIVVVDDVTDQSRVAAAASELFAQRTSVVAFRGHSLPRIFVLGASDRRVVIHSTVVWHDLGKHDLEARLTRLAQKATTVAAGLRAIAADQVAAARTAEAAERAAEKAAEQQKRYQQRTMNIVIPVLVVLGVLLFVVLPFYLARRSRGDGGRASYDIGSSSSSAYVSSSSSYSGGSSSVDTSYSGGGGTSGGGGASDSY